MENKDEYKEPLAVIETIKEKKICKCCGKEFPITMFSKKGTGYRNICISCEHGDINASEKFKQFSSRELMEELRIRGFKGTLKYVKIEEYNI